MITLENGPACNDAGRRTFLSSFPLARPIKAVLRWLALVRNRSMVESLREFDDQRLADIGLTRRDVEFALDAPLSQDPSWHLIRARQNPLKGTRHR